MADDIDDLLDEVESKYVKDRNIEARSTNPKQPRLKKSLLFSNECQNQMSCRVTYLREVAILVYDSPVTFLNTISEVENGVSLCNSSFTLWVPQCSIFNIGMVGAIRQSSDALGTFRLHTFVWRVFIDIWLVSAFSWTFDKLWLYLKLCNKPRMCLITMFNSWVQAQKHLYVEFGELRPPWVKFGQ